MSSLTLKQQYFLAMFTGDERAQAEKALLDGQLWADVIPCANGQYATGSMSMENVPAELSELEGAPCLSFNRDEVQKDIDEECSRYEAEIAEGERDEEDEYEGMLMRVVWKSDDTLLFFMPTDATNDDPIAINTVDEACGF